MYQVLARKCRPQSFDELVGQPHVARTLGNALRSGRLAHAYLFAGLRGTGKTTVARILAKCLNCEKGPTAEPCGVCVPCREIAESRAIDVLELDAATRTQVDNIRELQEMLSYAPVRDRHKVLIIDEAHMLSKQAANALLKTIEEPPPNVVFVLATTELHKILPTIQSRCQVFEFRRVAVGELVDYLKSICAAEKIAISDVALERIARSGEGSVRDSLSVLERVVAFCGREVADDDVLRMLGGLRFEVLEGWTRALAARDAAGMLEVLDRLVDEGHDLLHFWSELVALLRDLLLLDALPGRDDVLARAAEEARRLREAAAGLSTDDLSRAFQILADLEPGLKVSSQPRFLFDAALIRLAALGSLVPLERLLAGLSGPQRDLPARRERSVSASGSPPPPAPTTRRGEPRAATPADFGRALAESLHGEKPMLGTILDGASIELAGEKLRVSLAADRRSLLPQLARKENTSVIEAHASKLAGRAVRLDASAPEAPAPAPEGGQPTRSTEAANASTPVAGHGSLLERATGEPGVKKLLRDFGAQVIEIGPLGTPGTQTADSDGSDATEDAT